MNGRLLPAPNSNRGMRPYSMGTQSCEISALGKYSRSAQVPTVQGGAPRSPVPTPPAGRSDKGPGPGRTRTHRSDSWSTCTAPPPWCPRPLRPCRARAACTRSPAPSPLPAPGGEEPRQQGHLPALPSRPLPASRPSAGTPGGSHIVGPGVRVPAAASASEDWTRLPHRCKEAQALGGGTEGPLKPLKWRK